MQFILVGAVYNNALTGDCATRVCCACKDMKTAGVAMSSDTANKSRKRHGRKSSPFPHFRSGHMSAICARLTDKGKGRSPKKRKKTAGCPSFATAGAGNAPPSADGKSAEGSAENSPPVRGRHAHAVRAPRSARCRKKSRPRQSEPTAAVRVPQSSGAGKGRPDGPSQASNKIPLDIPQSPTTNYCLETK